MKIYFHSGKCPCHSGKKCLRPFILYIWYEQDFIRQSMLQHQDTFGRQIRLWLWLNSEQLKSADVCCYNTGIVFGRMLYTENETKDVAAWLLFAANVQPMLLLLRALSFNIYSIFCFVFGSTDKVFCASLLFADMQPCTKLTEWPQFLSLFLNMNGSLMVGVKRLHDYVLMAFEQN